MNGSLPVSEQGRLFSLDAFPGFFMVVLLSGTYRECDQGFGLADIAGRLTDHWVWNFLGYKFSHLKCTQL